MAENEVFDIDAVAAEYQPVRIKFRGTEYVLGATVLQVIAATELAPGEGASGMVARLPEYLRTLCPEIGPALEGRPLISAEEVALLRPITAVMNRFNAVSKSQEGAE